MANNRNFMAVIDPAASIAKDVEIGQGAIIGPNVEIGAGSKIGPYSIIERNTKIGENNKISAFSSIGSAPQHINYQQGEDDWLVIGDNNVIREYVTINRGTEEGDGRTVIGNDNYIMAYAHIAHDCQVGNHTIFANTASLAGHVTIGDHAILGAFSGVHQYVKIGEYSFLGRATKIYNDILPYMLVTGNPGVPASLNKVGLHRHGFADESMRYLKKAFLIIYRRGLRLEQVKSELTQLAEKCREVANLLHALNSSDRGIARHMREDG